MKQNYSTAYFFVLHKKKQLLYENVYEIIIKIYKIV